MSSVLKVLLPLGSKSPFAQRERKGELLQLCPTPTCTWGIFDHMLSDFVVGQEDGGSSRIDLSPPTLAPPCLWLEIGIVSEFSAIQYSRYSEHL